MQLSRFRAATPFVFLLALLCGSPLLAAAQPQIDLSFLATRAEESDFEETTRYDEVRAFLDVLARASDSIRLTRFGYTTEGRSLPLVVYGDVGDTTPEAVQASEGTRVFIQANIHGGEVAGKEAALMLLRALAAGQHAEWADSLVVLVAPIYNADGNERISLYNRPLQHGPIGGMGQRPNAQGYDLNRDHMKLDSPEARSLVQLFRRYDPHVVVDLHTTNGTHHAYHLTYSPPLHPSTDTSIVRPLREDWLLALRQAAEARHGYLFYHYGNVPPPEAEAERGWYTFDHRPRFNNNYVGLRNRLAILGEAYAYLPFEERIRVSLRFTEEILHYAHENAQRLQQVTAAADSQSVAGDTLALRATYRRSEELVPIFMGAVAEEKHPYTGRTILCRKKEVHPEKMPAFHSFRPTEMARAPEVYYVPPEAEAAVDLVEAHGLRHDVLERAQTVEVERFRIDSVRIEEESYEGHRPQQLFGMWETAEVTLPEGTLAVPVDQPLGRLAFVLLEPQSDDGVAHWNLLEEEQQESFYPIVRRPVR